MKTVLVNTKQLPEQETGFLTETTKKKAEKTQKMSTMTVKREKPTHAHRHSTAAGTDIRFHRHWVDAMPAL